MTSVKIFFIVIIIILLGASQSRESEYVICPGGDTLNIRSGPGLDYKIISQIKESQKLKFLSEKKDWYEIELNDGRRGWIFAPLVSLSSSEQNWPCYRGNSEHTGSVNNTSIISGKEKWSLSLKSKISFTSSPVFMKGKIYTGADNGRIYCIDGEKGKIDWYFQGESPVMSTPAIDEKKLYFESEDGMVYAINISSGEKIWSFLRDAGSSGYSPLITDDKLIYIPGQMNKSLYAITSDKGTVKWKFSLEDTLSCPCFSEETICFGSSGGKVYCLDKEKGNVKWKTDSGGCAGFTFSGENFIYSLSTGTESFNEGDNILYALDKLTGEKKWSFKFNSPIFIPVLIEDKIYAGSYDKKLYVIDGISGKELLAMKNETWPVSLAASPGVIYVGLYDGTLYALELNTWKQLWSLKFDSIISGLCLSGNSLYISTENGKICALE